MLCTMVLSYFYDFIVNLVAKERFIVVCFETSKCTLNWSEAQYHSGLTQTQLLSIFHITALNMNALAVRNPCHSVIGQHDYNNVQVCHQNLMNI